MHLTNQGGAARGVEFAAAVGQRMVFGVPHPAPLFRSGESRLIQTAIPVTRDDTIVGFVSCYDIRAKHNYVWWPDGEHRVYDFRREKVSPSSLMQRVAPGFDIESMTPVRYKTIERTF